MVCFGPTVMSSRPPPASRKDMLCRTYIGMATIFCDPIWYDINRKFPSGGMKDRILSDCNHIHKVTRYTHLQEHKWNMRELVTEVLYTRFIMQQIYQNSVHFQCSSIYCFVSIPITKPCQKKCHLGIKFTIMNCLKIPVTKIMVKWLQRMKNCFVRPQFQ